MSSTTRRVWREFLASTAAYLALTALLIGLCIARNHGVFVYPLDDSYIHMAIAKNIALHGVWGVSPHEFGNASSSPGYTVLLSAIYLITGPHVSTPLLLNVIFGLVFLYVFSLFVAKWWPNAKWHTRVAAGIAATVILPLPILTVIAMEHVLHALMILLLADAFLDCLADETKPNIAWRLPLLAAVSILVRYETGFVLLPMLVMLVIRKNWWPAITTGLSAAAAVLIVGLVFKYHGAEMFPNSVLIKSSVILGRMSRGEVIGAFAFAGNGALHKLRQEPLLAWCCMVIGLSVFAPRSTVERNYDDPSRYPAWRVTAIAAFALCACTLAIHLLSSAPVWFFRYQSYLAALCCAGLVVSLSGGLGSRRRFLAVLLLLLAVGSVGRMWNGFARTTQASQNIHDQQYQMARFLREYYPGAPVAVNDIGAVSYFAGTATVDLYGLGNNRIAKMKRAREFGVDEIESVCKSYGVGVAIVYDRWFPDLPKSWRRICRWTIADNFICGGKTVSFYATTPSAAAMLREDLTSFARKLPRNVVVAWD